MEAITDYSDADKTIRDLRQKDDQEANSSILPSQQFRQRPAAMEFVVFIGFVFDRLERVIHMVVFTEMGRTSFFFSKKSKEFRLQEMAIPLLATGVSTVHRTSHVSSQAHFMSHAQCTWLDRIRLPLPRSTPSLLYLLNGSIPLQSASWRSVWSSMCRRSTCWAGRRRSTSRPASAPTR